MRVQFNEPVLVPANYSTFNNSFMHIKLVVGKDSNKTELNFDWSI
jgi:hypothetical protein